MKTRKIDPKVLKLHPLSHLIPDMRNNEWRDFYADIVMRGIKVPLEVLADGTVVDGRHRLRAAIELGMKQVPIVDAPLNGDSPEAYMLKAAILRRHLTDDQRSIIAARWKEENKKQGKRTDLASAERAAEVKDTSPTRTEATEFFKRTDLTSAQRGAEVQDASPTRAKATEFFKVSRRKIDEASYVQNHAPKIAEKVLQGRLKLSKAYQQARREKNRSSPSLPPDYQQDMSILTGDFCDMRHMIPEADLVFTDPPYAEADIDLYDKVAELAKDKLKPGGLCLVYAPHLHLAKVIDAMSQYLDYWWIFGVAQTGSEPRIWKNHIWVGWKPILAFIKPGQRLTDSWFRDWYRGAGEDKRFHKWGQDVTEASYFIEVLTPPGGLVVDPLCGAGTIPLAAQKTGRNWLGIDKDPTAVASARERLQNNANP